MPPPAAVLLDLFDTIVHSEWAVWRDRLGDLLGVDAYTLHQAYSTTRAARNTGRHPDEEADMRALIEGAGIDDPPIDLVRTCGSALYELMHAGIRLYDDVVPTVTALRESGTSTALISNCDHFAADLVDRLGLHDLFDVVILSFEAGAMKPAPVIYRTALEALGEVDPVDAVFVDDQTSFCDGARDLGIDSRLLIRAEARPPEGVSVDSNGHQVIADLTALLPS